jgi:hypothetical protein
MYTEYLVLKSGYVHVLLNSWRAREQQGVGSV